MAALVGNSALVDSKNPRQANLAEQYGDCRGMPMNDRAEPTLTMFPRSRVRMRLSAAIVPHTCPRKVTSMARRKSSDFVSERGEKLVVMALLTQMSSGPSSFSARERPDRRHRNRRYPPRR